MEAFLISLTTVGVAEIGDRTQLLALMLAARFRKPWAILAAVLCSALLNNAVAGLVGVRVARYLTPRLLNGIVGVSLIAMALWALKSDVAPEQSEKAGRRHGAFLTTLITFSIAEMGDKTQIAALTLAAAYSNLWAVVAGTTAGLVFANVPAVFIGHAAAQRLPLKAIHYVSSALFLLLGVVFLVRAAHAAY
jgi:putative Ca2+/H+ antiporter (TMEM165/GDT1 family)